MGFEMSFCRSIDVIWWVYRCHFVSQEMSFYVSRNVILCIEMSFGGSRISFRGSRDIILWV